MSLDGVRNSGQAGRKQALARLLEKPTAKYYGPRRDARRLGVIH